MVLHHQHGRIQSLVTGSQLTLKSAHKDASMLQGEKGISQTPRYHGQGPGNHGRHQL